MGFGIDYIGQYLKPRDLKFWGKLVSYYNSFFVL